MGNAQPFAGLTVGIFETRRQREFSAMFASRGANVLPCPLVFPESYGIEEPVRKFIEKMLERKFVAAIFYTGIGVHAVFDAAQQLGKYETLKEALRGLVLIARGPKSKAALKRHDLTPGFLAEPPTTEGLVKRLDELDLRGKRVAVALAGDQPSTLLADAVRRGGGELCQCAPYHYRLPEDLSSLGDFVKKVLTRGVDILVFTTPPQVTILLEAAEKLGLARELASAMQAPITVAAVGRVTAATLERNGVRVSVRPPEDDETMMGLVKAVAAALSGSS